MEKFDFQKYFFNKKYDFLKNQKYRFFRKKSKILMIFSKKKNKNFDFFEKTIKLFDFSKNHFFFVENIFENRISP